MKYHYAECPLPSAILIHSVERQSFHLPFDKCHSVECRGAFERMTVSLGSGSDVNWKDLRLVFN